MYENTIVILGDILLDEYVNCEYQRINRESPGVIFLEKSSRYSLGGAGNLANNLLHLNQNVIMFACLANDNKNELLVNVNEKLDYSNCIISEIKNTVTKKRYLAKGHQVFRIDKEEKYYLNSQEKEILINNFNILVKKKKIDLLLISDYNLGLIDSEITNKFITIANKNNIPSFIDPRIDDIYKFSDSYLLKPNRNEYYDLCKKLDLSNEISNFNMKKISQKLNISYLLVTLDKEGMCLYENKSNKLINFPLDSDNKVVDVSGAGDVTLASLSYLYLTESKDFTKIIPNTIKLASYSTTVSGCMILNFNIIKKVLYNSKIISIKDIKYFKDNYKKTSFTNGCFDLLHQGHIESFKECKEISDILYVGVNSDKSIKRLKGDNRPIINQEGRINMLQAIEYIDFIVIFDEDTPIKIIEELQPDIYVKGNDYKIDEIREFVGDNVKEIVIQKRKDIKSISTSAIIKKLKNNN
ncbi:pfkB family carbohydrate kinase [seawater metagenome]|uniref:PfkB family carbohydrate kinase n=1 Tax=seawater metagenome TaxID=1561972 RepID=A0A5E8CLM3_9ZZZZ